MITKSCCVETMSGKHVHSDQYRISCVKIAAEECGRIFRNENKCGADPDVWKKICDFQKNDSGTSDVTIDEVEDVIKKINAWLQEETDKQRCEHCKNFPNAGNDRFHSSMILLPKNNAGSA